jgi:hypothetical protein
MDYLLLPNGTVLALKALDSVPSVIRRANEQRAICTYWYVAENDQWCCAFNEARGGIAIDRSCVPDVVLLAHTMVT